MREIIRASAWSGFRELVIGMGGDADAILAAAHVDVAALADPERYLPLRALLDSQAIAAERLARKDFGLQFGQEQNLSALGALSIAIINSPTARAGIEMAARYVHFHNPAITVTLSPMPRTARDFLSASLDLKNQKRREQNDERIISSFHKSLGLLGGASYKPLEIWFMHEPIAPLAIYRKMFGLTPSFGRPVMGIAIERVVLDTWRPGGSSHMREIAETYLHTQSPSLEKEFTQRVTTMARSLLKGRECTPEQAAKALGIHARTLQRRLKEEGASFERIKDDVRREWAESLLIQPSVSLSQIAQMLDYANSSTFSRSCRRWFGEAPRTYRTRLTQARTPKNPGPRAPRVNPLVATCAKAVSTSTKTGGHDQRRSSDVKRRQWFGCRQKAKCYTAVRFGCDGLRLPHADQGKPSQRLSEALSEPACAHSRENDDRQRDADEEHENGAHDY